MDNLKIVVFTCDKYLWLTRGFAYLFNTYWSSLQEVTIAGYSAPQFKLPSNFSFHSIATPEYPMKKWSNGAIEYLLSIDNSHVLILLDDYWLVRTVDHNGIRTLHEYAKENKDVLRVDLTSDRLYNGKMERIGFYGHYDIVETPPDSPYQMSLQAGIWNREHLLSSWQPNWSAHQIELIGSPALHDRDDLRVVGTQQVPIRYANIMKDTKGFVKREFFRINSRHREVISGTIPKGIL